MKALAAIKKLYQEKICVKTFARIVLFITIMASSFTAVFISQQSQALTDNLVKRGGSLAELLAYNIRLCVFAESKDMCSESAKGLLHQEDILSVLIFTLEGRLLTKLEKPGRKMPGSGEGPDNKRLAYVKKNVAERRSHFYLEETGAALNFWAPVISVSKSSAGKALYFEEMTFPEREHIIGYVEIIIDKEGLRKQLKALLYRGFLMGGVFLLLGFAGTYYAIKKITSPIEKLSAASVEISRGNPALHVEVTSSDEIGRLAQSFNKMAVDLKDSERKYKELIGELDLKVRERTEQLLEAQEELVRKEKLATLGQLAGSVGHELRNPLGVMSNAVYYLKTVMSDADETVKEYLNMIKSEINNSERIISDLLDFSRVKTPQTQSTSINELIQQSLEKCTVPDNVNIRLEIPEEFPAINVDPLHMEQIFKNLIINAVQAMPDGGELRIGARLLPDVEAPRWVALEERKEGRVAASPLQKYNNFVEISITDTGEGISPENMKNLFQPLFTTKAKGIGLGLVVCKNLVEANGGRIQVESEPGKGTTFTVVLPCKRK
jgi:signal transduction histidine kinase